MTEATLTERPAPDTAAAMAMGAAPVLAPTCDACLGSGGWFRYEPALEPSPGLLYLSCVHCRGSGRAAGPRA